MSENEKLRALLAEWRESLGDPCKETDCTFGPCVLAGRIDVALAEPVVDYQRERDEARAEAERLLTVASRLEVVQAQWEKQADRNLRERDEARAEVATAYQRGAEAMREAAMGAAWHSSAMGVHAKIRDLPIPEDKS